VHPRSIFFHLAELLQKLYVSEGGQAPIYSEDSVEMNQSPTVLG